MVSFIDAHRAQYGVESICTLLPIAPSTDHRHRRQAADPTQRSARARRDDTLRVEIQRVYDERHQVYGPAMSGSSSGAKGSVRRAAPSSA